MAIYLLISQLPTWATTVIVEVVIGDKKSRPCLLTKKEGKDMKCLVSCFISCFCYVWGDTTYMLYLIIYKDDHVVIYWRKMF